MMSNKENENRQEDLLQKKQCFGNKELTDDAKDTSYQLQALLDRKGVQENTTLISNTLELKEPASDEKAKICEQAVDDDNVDVSNPDVTIKEREKWSRSIECVLSILGYGVGLGSLWRFPFLCMKNGGGAFLFPYVICLTTCGLPLVFIEMAIGQFVGKSSIHAWAICPLFRGIGYGMMIISSIYVVSFTLTMAWVLYYLVNALRPDLPWSTCNGWWNTRQCFDMTNLMERKSTFRINETIANDSSINGAKLTNPFLQNKTSSEEEFWQHNVLQVTSGLDDLGSMHWFLALSLFVCWVILFLCIMKGTQSVGKVIYVTAVMPYVLLLILLVKGLTLNGAVDGIVYLLKPDLKRMMTVQVWLEAAGQVFLSLGFGFGPIITMTSYNKFNNNCFRDALIVTFGIGATGFFSSFVVFTVLGFISHETGLPFIEVVSTGPGLAFVVYPRALAQLPLPQLWSILFFLMLLLLAVDCLFGSVEGVVAGIMDLYPRYQNRRMFVSLIVCIIGFILGLPLCLQGGMYIFQLFDWYCATIAIPVHGLLECMIIGWIYGTERFCRDIQLMLGRDVPVLLRLCWCFITPLLLLIVLVFSLMTYVPPVYGNYIYPTAGQVIGWSIAFVPLVPTVVIIFKDLVQHKNEPIKTVVTRQLHASPEWRPQDPEQQDSYRENMYSYTGTSVIRRIKVNLFGDTPRI